MNDAPQTNPSEGSEEQPYSGNIWGWRFSLYSLALILLFVAIAVYRHITLGVPFTRPAEPEKQEIPRDTSFGKDTMR